MSEKEPSEDKELLDEMMDRHSIAVEAESDNHDRAREAIKFEDLEQWPASIKNKRESDPEGSRPCLVLDKVGQYKRQIVNDQRKARPGIKVRPVDDKADVRTAKIYQGLIRDIELQSKASVAYDRAGDHAVGGGFGYFRVVTEYADDESFYQDIRIKSVRNRFSVLLDPNRQEPDGSDAMWGFVYEDIPIKEFRRNYPKAQEIDFTSPEVTKKPNWVNEKMIRVAEYYKFKVSKEEIYLLENGEIITAEEYDKATPENNPELYAPEMQMQPMDGLLQESGQFRKLKVEAKRKREKKQLCWYKATALEILDYRELPGRYIPIIEVIGTEIDDEGTSKKSGAIRAAMDAQRLYNYAASSFTEQVALQPKAPYIAEAGQIEQFADEWMQANTRNISTLRYKGVAIDGRLVPPPQRQVPPQLSVAWTQGMLNFEHDIQGAMGMYNASLGADSNEKSGTALARKQEDADTNSFHFMDNLSMSIEHCGRIIVDLIPYYYDTKRIARILGDDDKEQMVQLDPNLKEAAHKYQDNEGNIKYKYNLGVGRYDVRVVTGQSFSTKRQELVDLLTGVVNGNPEMMKLVGDMLFKNLDVDGAEEIAERLRRMLPTELQMEDMDDEENAEARKFMGVIQQLQQQLQQVMQDKETLDAENRAKELQIDAAEAKTKQYDAETKRMQVASEQKIDMLNEDMAFVKDALNRILGMPVGGQGEQRPQV